MWKKSLFLAVVLSIAGCDSFSFFEIMAGAATAGGELRISPLSLTLEVNTLCTFTATGGQPPYAFSVVSGGGSINASTGVFTAPSEPASVAVRVTDQRGTTKEALITCVR